MEKLKPIKAKSPISSLKFQRKSDFKKFLNFIKVQTKQLKGISEPKENKIKNILGGKATSLGILGAGALLLFGGEDKDDEFETGKGSGQVPDLYAAIGRRNEPKALPKVPIGLKPFVKSESQFEKGTRTNVTRGRSFAERRALKVNPGFAERRAIKKRVELVEKTEDLQQKRDIKKRFSKNLTKTKQLVKVGEVGDQTKKISAPRTPVKNYGKMGFQKFFGGTRVGKVRPKLGFMIDPLSGDIIPDPNATSPEALKNIKRVVNKITLENFARLADPEVDALRDAASKTSPPPDVVDFFRGQKYLKNRKKPISRRFKNLRKGVMGATDRDPSGRVTDTLSKKTFPEKSFLAKLTRRLLGRPNPKITKDSFLGMSYKGPKLSMIAKAVNNPVVKVVLLGFDILNTIRAGGKVLNPRDNLAVALYDLYVSINNSIFKDNPEKLKLYQSLSSDEKLRIKQVRRNMEIIKLKEAVTAAEGESGGNNIIVVPQNQQSNNVSGGGNEMPRQTGGDDISFFPSEPLNIGDDILLSKLNQ